MPRFYCRRHQVTDCLIKTHPGGQKKTGAMTGTGFRGDKASLVFNTQRLFQPTLEFFTQ